MIRKLWNSAAGMLAQSFKIDVIANNVANVNTTGFKKKEVQFQDLLYRPVESPGAPTVPGSGENLLIGQGVRPSLTQTYFMQGILQETGRELDMGIEGEGFFHILLPDGRQGFTRAGAFILDANLNLVTDDGYRADLLPPELRGLDFASISVEPHGALRLLDGDGEVIGEGRATLFRFTNPEGLEAIGKNLWVATENSGEPQRGRPGDEGFGLLKQKFLEQSNVSLLEEMTRLILAQRGYEISSRAVRTADDMWSMANQIRK